MKRKPGDEYPVIEPGQPMCLHVGHLSNMPLIDMLVAGYDSDGDLFVSSNMEPKAVGFLLDEIWKLLHTQLKADQ